jgi:hypothetical protein
MRRVPLLASALVLLAWLGLMAYVWLRSRPDWGWGWALVGTVNLTTLALLLLAVIWLITRAVSRHVRHR